MSAFVAEHALSFKAMDHLGELAKVVFRDSAIARGVSLHKTKCESIIKNVLAKAETEVLAHRLGASKFSIFVDEGTDITNTKLLCCVVRYFQKSKTNVMVGERNSLMTRLREKADDSFITIRCICHSLHIAASKAALKLPRNVEDLLRNIANYFSHSCKRQAQLAEL
ncbi:unnamed protein product [Ixodes pacificus]